MTPGKKEQFDNEIKKLEKKLEESFCKYLVKHRNLHLHKLITRYEIAQKQNAYTLLFQEYLRKCQILKRLFLYPELSKSNF